MAMSDGPSGNLTNCARTNSEPKTSATGHGNGNALDLEAPERGNCWPNGLQAQRQAPLRRKARQRKRAERCVPVRWSAWLTRRPRKVTVGTLGDGCSNCEHRACLVRDGCGHALGRSQRTLGKLQRSARESYTTRRGYDPNTRGKAAHSGARGRRQRALGGLQRTLGKSRRTQERLGPTAKTGWNRSPLTDSKLSDRGWRGKASTRRERTPDRQHSVR